MFTAGVLEGAFFFSLSTLAMNDLLLVILAWALAVASSFNKISYVAAIGAFY